jgi:small subunit ribosomal protein S4e
MKRMSMPKTWKIGRKKSPWVTRPHPGTHSLRLCMSLETVMKEFIKCANTRSEALSILQKKKVLVDGVQRKDLKFPVGLMDVVSLPEINEYYRMIIDNHGKLQTIKISKEESAIKPCRIANKLMAKKGLVQISLSDSRNMLFKKGEKLSYKVGDTLLISLPDQKIKEHFSLEKGSAVYLIGGKQIGKTGKIEEITGDVLKFKSEDEDLFETAKRYAFIIGAGKPAIHLHEEHKKKE